MTIRVLLCTALLATTIGSPATASETDFWSPPVLVGVRSDQCEAAFEHRQSVRVPAGEALVLQVTVPAGVQLQELRFYYRFNSGGTQVVTNSGSAPSTTFTLPSGHFLDGTTLDYAFAAFFTAATGPCFGAGLALLPPKYGYHLVASATDDWTASPISASLNRAVAIMSAQPGSQDAPQICARFFTTPTPCDIYDGSATGDQDSQGGALDLVLDRLEAPGGIPPGYDEHCDLYSPSGMHYDFYTGPVNTGAIPFARGVARHSAENGDVKFNTFLGAVFGTNASFTHRADVGYAAAFTWTGSSTSFPATVTMSWKWYGRRSAHLTETVPLTTASATPWTELSAVRGKLSPSGLRTDLNVGGAFDSMGTNGISVIGPGVDGLGGGPHPDEDVQFKESPPRMTWDLHLTKNQIYGFWMRVTHTLSASTTFGGAMAKVDNEGDPLNYWRIRAPHLRVTDNSGTGYFTNC